MATNIDDLKTYILVDDKPIYTAAPWTINVVRGTQPSQVSFIIPDTEEHKTLFDDIKKPITIKITAPDRQNMPQTLELKDWYIISIEPHSPGFWQMEVVDNRWVANQKSITKDFNTQIVSYKEEPQYREGSLSGGEVWRSIDAAEAAIKSIGVKYEDRSKGLKPSQRYAFLPNNITNSLGGGLVAMPFAEAMPKLLFTSHLDPIVLPNGKMTFVDRNTKVSGPLQDFMLTAGVVDDKKWRGLPKKVRVFMQRRVEFAFKIFEGRTSSSDDMVADMVIPPSDPETADTGWEVFEDELDKYGYNVAHVRKHFLNPAIFPITGTETTQLRNELIALNTNVSQFYRTVFRPDIFRGAKDANILNIKLGHLGADGQTVSDQCVYMPYERQHNSLLPTAFSGGVIAALDIALSNPKKFNLKYPAPWTPKFITDSDGEIIIVLSSNNTSKLVKDWPGELTERISFGNVLDKPDLNFKLPIQTQPELASSWFVWVFYHALLCGPRPDLGFDEELGLQMIELDAFPDGDIESLDYSIEDLTANYVTDRTNIPGGPTNGNAKLELNWVNEAECTKRAENIKSQVLNQFPDGEVGIATTHGVSAIVDGGMWPEGNIYSLQIIGGAKPGEIKCIWRCALSTRDIITGDEAKMLRGQPSRRIG